MSHPEIKASVQAVRSYLEAIGHPIGQVQGHEVVALARGLKNKHVLSSHDGPAASACAGNAPEVGPAEQKVLALFEGLDEHLPVMVYVDVFAVTESGEAPDWVQIELDQALMGLLRKGASLTAREKQLEHVSFDVNPSDWGGGDDRTNWSLYVSSREFWYHGYPKYDDPVQTRAIDLDRLLALIRQGHGKTAFGDAAWIDGKIYWDGSCNPAGLAQIVMDGSSGVEDRDEDDEDRDEEDSAGNASDSEVVNHYKCDACGHEWTDVWECEVEDDCPHCGLRHMTPFYSDDGSMPNLDDVGTWVRTIHAQNFKDANGVKKREWIEQYLAARREEQTRRLDSVTAQALAKHFDEFAPDAVRDQEGVDVRCFTVQDEDVGQFSRALQGVREVRLWDGGIALIDESGASEVHVLPRSSPDAEVVQALVDDVRERARKHGFSISSYANALELVAQSADVLGLNASREEREAAAKQLS